MSVILNSPNVVIGHMSGGTININNNYSTQPAKQQQRVCEDVETVQQEQPQDTTCAKNAQVTTQQPLPFFVPEKLEELGLYTLEQFTAMYREAVEGDAHTLADFLHKYEKVGVFDFRGYEKKEIHETLMAYFPNMRAYSYTNFIYYF